MSADDGSSDELKDLLRQVVASNLTVAYLLEQTRRERHPKDDEHHHPFAQVLEIFEMISEIMEPSDDEELEDGGEEEDLAFGGTQPPSAAKGSPFESTIRYLRPKRKKPEEP